VTTRSSSLAPLDAAQPGPAPTRPSSAALFAALEGTALSIPTSLGSVAIVFSKIGGELTAQAIVASLLAVAVLQFVMANGRRPVLYAARVFEAITLAAMIDRLIPHLALWQLPDTPGVRMALLCLLVAGAGVVVALLYAVRADRYSRHIPAPVFAGFSNSIAVLTLLSQAKAISRLWDNAVVSAGGTAVIVVVAFATMLGVRRWLPRWPAAACALAAGLLAGVALTAAGQSVPMLGSAGLTLAVPAALADFRALVQTEALWPMVSSLALDATILGAMVFINTSIASQAVSHLDERPSEGLRRQLASAACISAAGAFGAAPLSGSLQSSMAALRLQPLSPAVLRFSALVMSFVALSGVLTLVPVAAVAGTLLCDACFMVDRPSLRLARQWIARQAMSRHAREDLALIAAVTASAILFNMVASVIVGMLLGLALFASRQFLPPVRAISDGTRMSSNCARSRADTQALATHGDALHVVQLEGDLFFGTMDSMDRSLRQAIEGAQVLVIDWTEVRYVDSSALQSMAKFQRAARARGVPLVHVEPRRSNADTVSVLMPVLGLDQVLPDLDRALEAAENQLLLARPHTVATETTSLLEAISLFKGMDERERTLVEQQFEQRVFSKGATVVSAGEAGDDLLVVLHGSASVLVPDEAGTPMRVAGLRRGAVIGEMAFLDRSPRSATVVAEEDMVLAVLDRPTYERLGHDEPELVQKLLANLALYLATRLRHTTRMASRRHGRNRA